MQNMEKLTLFQHIEQKEIEKMLKCAKAKQRVFEKEEYIFYQEDKPKNLYIVLEGSVCISKNFSSGKRDVLYTAEKGQLFGEIFLSGNTNQYWYDALAYTDCKILQIPWNFFYGFCKNACHHHQQITQNMLEILSEKSFQTIKKLHIVSAASLRERLAIWLIDSMDGKDYVELNMNRETMADFLCVARPSLSRELMKMQADGLIEVTKRRIYIKDKEQLSFL